ncbi:MAG: carboxymuconolactone decarboxylase family protein [Hyphomicrobiaceae bacterium]
MARIPLIDENDPNAPAEARERLLEAKLARGKLVNVYRALANKPTALAAFTGFANAVYRKGSSLDPRHAELAYLTTTATNDCFY